MFAKPQWFRKKRFGWGLRPVSWQGWTYAMLWGVVICGPFVALLASQLLIESLIWAVVMMFMLLVDVRHVMGEMCRTRNDDADLLVIDENTPIDPDYLATRSYDLRLRR